MAIYNLLRTLCGVYCMYDNIHMEHHIDDINKSERKYKNDSLCSIQILNHVYIISHCGVF